MLRNASRRLLRSRRLGAAIRQHYWLRSPCPSCSQGFPSTIRPLHVDLVRLSRSRHFSTTPEVDVERVIQRILNPHTTPLGTMSPSLIQDAMDECHYWLEEGSGYSIYSADRLLERLLFEHASGASPAQLRTLEIAHLQTKVFYSWLKLGSFRMALERAEALLQDMVDWNIKGLSTQDPFPEMVALVEVSLEAGVYPANILLHWTETHESEEADKLVPLLNATLKLCVEAKDGRSARAICERMEKLSSECDGLVIDGEARKLLLDISLTTTTEAESAGDCTDEMSPFEMKLIQERFLEFLQTASLDDQQEAVHMMEQLNALPRSESTAELWRACVDYFIRIKDAQHATQSLQRLDVCNDLIDSGEAGVLFSNVLELWAKSSDEDAPWRAQEVIYRMEELENLGVVNITTASCNWLCEAWVNSKEPSALKKVEEILSVMRAAKKQGDESKAPNLETWKLYFRLHPTNFDMMSWAVSEVLHLGGNAGDLVEVVEAALEALASSQQGAHGKGNASSKLIRQAVQQGMSLTPTMCVNALKVYQVSRRNAALTRQLEFLESQPEIVLPLACYDIAIMTLLNAPEIHFDQKLALVSKLFERYSAGEVSAEENEIKTLMTRIMKELEFQERALPADTMLRLFERMVLSNAASIQDVRVPVDCFNSTLTCWSGERNVAKTEETFHRLLSYYQAGHTDLLPTTDSFHMLVKCLQRASDSTVEKAADVEATLEQMIALYESTGNDVCKPDAPCFNAVLLTWQKVGTEKAIAHSMNVLNRMLSLGVQPETFSFNVIMSTINHVDGVSKGKFRRVSSLKQQMQRLGLDPNKHTYAGILHACTDVRESSDTTKALKTAFDAMEQIRKSQEADAGVYSIFAKAIRHLLRGERDNNKRDKIASWVCRLCYEDGCLDERNERSFRALMSETAWKRTAKSFQTESDEIRSRPSRTTESEPTPQRSDNEMVVQ